MTTYYQRQIDRVLKIKPYGDRIRVKFAVCSTDGGEETETHWLSLTPQEVQQIRALLVRE